MNDMFSLEERRLLGLSKEENKALSFLTNKGYLISDLAVESKICRTSLYPILGRLKERGLVDYSRHGKRKYWHTISLPTLQEKLFSLAESHRAANRVVNREVGIVASQESDYKIYRGKRKLIEIYEELSRLPKGTRVYGIQPNLSVEGAVRNIPSSVLVKVNEGIKNRQVVVDSILQEDFLSYYSSLLKKLGRSEKDIFQSYGDRSAATTYVPRECLNFGAEIIFYDNIVCILNWQQLIAVVVKDTQVFGVMKELFELGKSAGKRVDQNSKVKELITKKYG